LNNEKHGEETQKTFYLYRHKDKCYHIDYCFLNPKHLKNFEILDNDEWLKMSDHLPILVEIY
jgi:endonuclease/exonuclease/phosphatase family metal-dependent hydrolase